MAPRIVSRLFAMAALPLVFWGCRNATGGSNTMGRTFVYVTSGHSPGRVLGFKLDEAGVLTANGSANVGVDPRFMSQGRSGLFLFVPNWTDGTVNSLTVHTPNGELTSDALTTGLSQPVEAVADPAAGHVYVLQSTGGVNVYNVTGQGTLTLASSAATPSGTPTHMVLSATGYLYVAVNGNGASSSGIQAFAVDASTGALTAGPFTSLAAGPGALMESPNHSFLVVTEPATTSQVLVIAVQDSGFLGTVTGTAVAGNMAGSAAMASTGAFLYVGNNGDGTVSAYQLSPTGTLSPVSGATAAAAGTSDLKVDPSDHYLVAANTFGHTLTVYSINGATGALVSVGSESISDGPVSLAIVHQP